MTNIHEIARFQSGISLPLCHLDLLHYSVYLPLTTQALISELPTHGLDLHSEVQRFSLALSGLFRHGCQLVFNGFNLLLEVVELLLVDAILVLLLAESPV